MLVRSFSISFREEAAAATGATTKRGLLPTSAASVIRSGLTMENGTSWPPFVNQTNFTDFLPQGLSCPVFTEKDEEILESFSFWMEGITQVNIAGIGIICNIVSTVILGDKEMRNR